MPTNPPPTLNSDRTTTPADILANGLSSDPAGTPVQSMCLHCKKQFETHKFSLFEREIIPSLCPVCDAARDTRLSEWIALCPREFRTKDEGGNTSLARIDMAGDTPVILGAQKHRRCDRRAVRPGMSRRGRQLHTDCLV